jgi:HD domain
MHDRYRSRFRVPTASTRLRQQIAQEAARRLFAEVVPKGAEPRSGWIDAIDANQYYSAKRRAAAVLGQRIRPGDLPSDSEVREHLIVLWRDSANPTESTDAMPEPEPGYTTASLADHLDRFTVYRLRLVPLESVKQNPRYHPEGDALYHSLQVFQLARDVHPYDEEFLLAALLHDVGKAIDPQDHVAAGVEALRGAVTERTLWLIEHHMDLLNARTRPLAPPLKRELEASEYFEDLKLLRDLDDAGRVPGQLVESIDEVLAYLRGLEHEAYLER